MAHDNDWELLDRYLVDGSHAAFEGLVSRHIDMVYSAARRRTGSGDLAEDVAQATFIVLARKARSIPRHRSLAAWLYRTARYGAIDAMRRRSVRQRHEVEAGKMRAEVSAGEGQWSSVAPYLDRALDSLPERDREAILLRFFQNQTLEQIAQRHGAAASTVQRRVERALGQLARALRAHGVEVAPAALGPLVLAHAVEPAPAAASVGLTSLATATGQLGASATGSIGLAQAIIKTMMILKLKAAAMLTVGVLLLGAGGVALQQAIAQQESPPPPPVAAAPPVAPASQPIASSAAKLEMDWQYVSVNATRFNPLANPGQTNTSSQAITITNAIRIVEPGNLVGFDRSNAVVTRMLDENGNDITRLATKTDMSRRYYHTLDYETRHDDVTHEMYSVLSRQEFRIPLQSTSDVPKRIAQIEGYVTALTRERVEHVDIPFKVSTTPVQIVPGVSLRFVEVDLKKNSYSYRMASDQAGDGQDKDSYNFNGQVSDTSPLPDRIIVERYFVDAKGERIDRHRHSAGFHASHGGDAGTGTGGRMGEAAAMRYEIAINPREERVPFVLKNIELPKVDLAPQITPPPATRQADLPPVARMEQALLRHLQRRRDQAQRNRWNDEKDQRVRELWKAFVVDHNSGAVKLVPQMTLDVLPDATSYDQYVGTYTTTEPRARGEAVAFTVRKDEQGRFLMDTPEGPSPAVCRNGALFAVFDDVMIIPENPLDPNSAPKLAGFWVIRSKGQTMLYMDTGRAMPPYVLQPKP